MPPPNPDDLTKTIQALSQKVQNLRRGAALNEQNTKSSLIAPLLTALGWEVHDPEEVHHEFKRKPRDLPVDYALMIQRTPVLIVEAKSLDVDLHDSKWTNQVISYSTQCGAGWAVLTNGVDYHIYNANAAVPLEGKLFCRVSLVTTDAAQAARQLALISKAAFLGKRIDRVWDAYHVDTQVREILTRAVSPEDDDLARLIEARSRGKLSQAAIRASLQRARITIDFPPAPHDPNEPKEQSRKSRSKPPDAAESSGPLSTLLARGLLQVSSVLVADYRGHPLKAVVTSTGRLIFDGKEFDSPSSAAGAARLPYFEGKLKGQKIPATNGWLFWSTHDPKSGELVTLDDLRRRIADA